MITGISRTLVRKGDAGLVVIEERAAFEEIDDVVGGRDGEGAEEEAPAGEEGGEFEFEEGEGRVEFGDEEGGEADEEEEDEGGERVVVEEDGVADAE